MTTAATMTMTKEYRSPYGVVVVDDSEIFIKGLQSLAMNENSHVQLLGWAHTPDEALKVCRRVRPQVVVVDLCLPPTSHTHRNRATMRRTAASGSGVHPTPSTHGKQLVRYTSPIYGLKLIRALCEQFSDSLRILATSSRKEDALVAQAILAGAGGFVDRDSDPDAFLDAIARVAQGEAYLDQHSRQVAEEVQRIRKHITPREKEVLRYVCMGYSNQEIAECLGIKVRTVESYVRSLCEKFGVRTRGQVSAEAWRLGICMSDGNGGVIILL